MKGDDVRLGFLAANIGKISSNEETIKGFFQRIKRQKEMKRQMEFAVYSHIVENVKDKEVADAIERHAKKLEETKK